MLKWLWVMTMDIILLCVQYIGVGHKYGISLVVFNWRILSGFARFVCSWYCKKGSKCLHNNNGNLGTCDSFSFKQKRKKNFATHVTNGDDDSITEEEETFEHKATQLGRRRAVNSSCGAFTNTYLSSTIFLLSLGGDQLTLNKF